MDEERSRECLSKLALSLRLSTAQYRDSSNRILMTGTREQVVTQRGTRPTHFHFAKKALCLRMMLCATYEIEPPHGG